MSVCVRRILSILLWFHRFLFFIYLLSITVTALHIVLRLPLTETQPVSAKVISIMQSPNICSSACAAELLGALLTFFALVQTQLPFLRIFLAGEITEIRKAKDSN